MAEEEHPEIEILRVTSTTTMGPGMKPVPRTYVTYRDAVGRVGMVVIPKEEPTDEEIAAAIRARMEEAKRPPVKRIRL